MLSDFFRDDTRIIQFDPSGTRQEVDKITSMLAHVVEDLYRSKLFLCHASEDWQAAESIASSLGQQGIPVWYDKWSLRVRRFHR